MIDPFAHIDKKDEPITVGLLISDFRYTLITIFLCFIVYDAKNDFPPFVIFLIGAGAFCAFCVAIFEWVHARFAIIRWIVSAIFIYVGFLWVLRSRWPMSW